MTAQIRVGGVWLQSLFNTADLVDSTIYRRDGWSGDYQASCAWAAPLDYSASWLTRGASYRVVEKGKTTWRGVVSEVTPSEGGWEIHAYGLGSLGDEYQAIYDPAGAPPLQPWAIPNDVVDYGIASRSLPWFRSDNLGTVAVGDPDGKITTIATVLTRDTNAQGKRWWVDTFGEVTYVSDPTTPTWMVTPDQPYLGTADDEFVTHLYGYYISSLDANGQPNGWSLVSASDTEAAARFGRREATVDLTSLGLMSTVDAQANIDGRFKLVGARMGWTQGLDLTVNNLRRPGYGAGDPLTVKAGQSVWIPGLVDGRSGPTVRGMIQFTIGEATRIHAEQRTTVSPIGFSPRDFQGALSPASSMSVEAA